MNTQSITPKDYEYDSPLEDCFFPGTAAGVLGGTPSGIFLAREVTCCHKTCQSTMGLCGPSDTPIPCSIQTKSCCAFTGITMGTAVAGCCLCVVLFTTLKYAYSSKETKKMFCEELSSPRLLLRNPSRYCCGRSQQAGKQIPQRATKNQSVDLSEGYAAVSAAAEASATCITSQPLPSAKPPEAVALIQPLPGNHDFPAAPSNFMEAV